MIQDAIVPTLDPGKSLSNFQKRAAAGFTGFPNKKNENWLYWAPNDTLIQALKTPLRSDDNRNSRTNSGADIDIINGQLVYNKDIAGLELSLNPDLILEKHPMSVGVETSSLAQLNSILFEQCVCIRITQPLTEALRIQIKADFSQEQASAVNRIIVLAEEQTSAVISVIHEQEIPESSTVNTFFENIGLKNSSVQITHVFESVNNHHFFHNPVHLYEGASCEQVRVVKGSKMNRQDTEFNFHGENASGKLQGIALLGDDNQNFNHLKVNHHVKNCVCVQNFKCLLADKAFSEFSGLVNVKAGAHGTSSTQSNKNLLLSDSARVISRPQLMIDADDVECGHGSIIGQLNPEEIHYIRSRGLSESQAKALLTLGFAEEIINEISDKNLKYDLIQYLHKRLPSFLENAN